ncbi:MAG: site-specific integrase [Acidobacteria bacterium]|nr:site-specific integrase [Acidobacteriota bacterium]MCW5949389.1 site-specific integrase [Pyrinomonadaceae bacterium]
MSVYKRYNGKRVSSSHPDYSKARWWIYKRLKGKVIHQSVPEAKTKQEAELAERQIIKASFDHSYNVTDTTTTLASFIDEKYRPYVQQNNVNKGAKELYIRLLLGHFKKQTLSSISPQDCRNCRTKLQTRQNKRKKESELSPASINRIMSTLSKIFSLACEEGILERNPMQYVKALPEPPPRRRLLNEKQKQDLWKELEKDTLLYRLIVLAVNLPLRRGQLMAITEDFIDFENEQVLVIGSKGRPPRLVPLNATATKVLKAMIEDEQLPFPVKDFRKRWYTALRNAGINKKGGTREENYHFHDLRSYFASELIKRNTNPLIVQNLFAHSDMSITTVYAQTDDKLLLEAVKRLDEIDDGESL